MVLRLKNKIKSSTVIYRERLVNRKEKKIKNFNYFLVFYKKKLIHIKKIFKYPRSLERWERHSFFLRTFTPRQARYYKLMRRRLKN